MKGLFSRGICAALLACILFNARAEAQTSMEIFAGGSPFLGKPANTVPVSPNALALGPNDDLFVADGPSGRLLRFDPATSTITSVPNLPGLLQYRFGGVRALDYGQDGLLNIVTSQEQWQLDLVEGWRIYLGLVGPTSSPSFAPDGTMYFSRFSEHAIYRRTTSGTTTTLVGSLNAGFSGDGTTSALFNNPRGVAIDAAGNIYIADSGNHRVRRRAAATGIITTVAGTGATNYNGDNLPALQTNLSTPTFLAIDTAGNLYINEEDGLRIRRLNAATGRITNFAGDGSLGGDSGNGGLAVNTWINSPVDMVTAGNGTVYIAEPNSNTVRKVDSSGIISHVIGNGTPSFCGEGVPALEACLALPNGIAIDDAGDVYVSDQNNKRIRKISAATGLITTIAGGNWYGSTGDGGPALNSFFPNGTSGIVVDAARNLYFTSDNRVRRIDAASGIISTVAGTGSFGFSGDGGPAVLARFNSINRLALDPSGNVYISDSFNHRVRRVDAATGIITTVAGTGVSNGPLGDGGAAIDASLGSPDTLAFDPAGNLLISDVSHYRIRKLNLATGVITTIAGNGAYGFGGNGGPATAAGIGHRPAFAVDAGGNIYLTSSYELRRIDAQTGIIAQAPAPIWGLYTPEGRGIDGASAMVLGSDNRLYVAAGSDVVLRVSGLPTPASDLTPPVIEPILTGTLGNNDWYRSDVQVSWSVTDAESAVTTTFGCEQALVHWNTEGMSYQCTATSSGGTAYRSILVKRDTVAPQLTFGTPSPASDASGWNSTDVSVPFNATDAMSGVYSTSSGSPVAITGTGSNLTASVVVTDFAGNTASFTTPAVNIDRTPPEVVGHVSGTLGSNDWYTSDVQVSWTVNAGASPVSSSEGCDASAVTADTSGTTFTCTATSAGGTNTQSVTIKRDATPPTLVFAAPSPAPNAAGWHNDDVSFAFTTSDGMSGIASTSSNSPVVITGEGSGLTASVTVIDTAGNSVSFTTSPVNIDRSVPLTVTPVIAGTLGNEGWYTSDVQVSWNTTGNIVSSTGCGISNVTADIATVTFSCSVTGANGTASNSVTLKRDATPPVLTWRAATPNANAAGWNRTNVNFPFDPPTDARSGIASVSTTSPLVVSAEGAGVTGAVTVTDRAGNVAVFTSTPRNIDKTAPTVNLRTPLHNKVYGLYSTLVADYDCTDAVSGTTSCSGTLADGATLNTRSMNGSYKFQVTSADVAGNSVTRSNTWSVAGTFLFDGYLAPMANDPTYNLVTAGSRVPMRFRLPDRNGGYVSDMTAYQSFTVNSERCITNSVLLNDVAIGGPGLSFDSATSTFTYNWDTNASWAGTCRNVVIRLIDGSRHTLFFKFQ